MHKVAKNHIIIMEVVPMKEQRLETLWGNNHNMSGEVELNKLLAGKWHVVHMCSFEGPDKPHSSFGVTVVIEKNTDETELKEQQVRVLWGNFTYMGGDKELKELLADGWHVVDMCSFREAGKYYGAYGVVVVIEKKTEEIKK